LTEEEAAARRLEGQDNVVLFKPPHSTREILRANALNIFNLSLVGLAVFQILLQKPLDAFLTTAVLVINIGLNVGQQAWARGRLKKLEQATRPQATMVREGMVRSIDPSQIVRGDILVVGPGDQILVDGRVLGEGQIVVDESMLTGDSQQHVRRAGDSVYAGGFCLAGSGAYEAEKVGSERLIVSLTGEFKAVKEELTPVERTIERLLRVLLALVAVFSLILLAEYAEFPFPGLLVDRFGSAASVIFGLAPASLLLMILVNYAMGTANLARVGALVHRSRSVESLAQSTVICFAQSGILTGVGLEMETIDLPRAGDEPQPRLADSRIRQILGTFARSTSAENRAVQAMAGAFPGSQRGFVDEMPFLSLYGWTAVAFDHDDLRGVYVFGAPEILEPRLVQDATRPAEAKDDEPRRATLRERLASVGHIFRRSESISPGEQPLVQPEESGDLETASEPMEERPRQGRLRGVMDNVIGRVNGLVRRVVPASDGGDASEDDADATRVEDAGLATVEELVYLVAYQPEIVPFHTAEGIPHLPADLLPLCRLHYSEEVRPEAVETIEKFSQTGVDFKVFSSDSPERTAAVLSQAGLGGSSGTPLRAISGADLAALDRERFARAATDNTIFGLVTPEQAGQVVDALHEQGEAVAVVGDGVSDLAAMLRSQLSITRQSSSPAALSVADIVLLGDSPQLLLRVLDMGQRIANGLLDILKLYLNQLVYLTLLILAIWGMGLGFPYQSKQGTLIAIATLVLPSLGLTLWAPAGVLPRTHLGWLLARFVAPAAVTISAATVIVYRIFLDKIGGFAYAQLAVTYMLVFSGLALVILLRPPVRPKVGGSERSGDWRPTALVLVLFVLVFIVAAIPLADQLLGLKPLRQLTHYFVIFLAVAAWVLAALFLWRVEPLGQILRRFRRQ
jgi:magnesium-transporting ATPase (P-type)